MRLPLRRRRNRQAEGRPEVAGVMQADVGALQVEQLLVLGPPGFPQRFRALGKLAPAANVASTSMHRDCSEYFDPAVLAALTQPRAQRAALDANPTNCCAYLAAETPAQKQSPKRRVN